MSYYPPPPPPNDPIWKQNQQIGGWILLILFPIGLLVLSIWLSVKILSLWLYFPKVMWPLTGVSLTVAGVMALLNANAVLAPPSASAGRDGFCDEFDDPTLNMGWSWIDPRGDSSYSLTETPGQLTLETVGRGHDLYQNTDAPRIVRSVAGDFVVRTKVLITPLQVFQAAGLLVWQDRSNYIWFARSLEGISSIETANGQRRDGPAVIRGIGSSESVHLRIERLGNSFLAHYSVGEGNWRQFTRVSLPVGRTVSVGPVLMSEWQDNRIQASFDYARFDDCAVLEGDARDRTEA